MSTLSVSVIQSIKTFPAEDFSEMNWNERFIEMEDMREVLDNPSGPLGSAIIHQAHLLAPFIYYQLKTTKEKGCISDEIEAQLKEHYYRTVASNLLKLSAATRVFRVFQEKKILTVPLKGIALIESLYPSPGVRPMSDVDLLIKSESISKVGHVLEDMGYRLVEYNRGSYNFFDKENGVALDIHSSFTRYDGLFHIDFEEICTRLHQINFNGQIQVQILCLEHQLIHIALHLAPGLYSQLNFINFLDLHQLVNQSRQQLDWEYILDFAKTSGISSYLYAPLHICTRLFHTNIPSAVLTELERALSRRKKKYVQHHYVARFLGNDLTWSRIFLERLSWTEGLRGKLKFLQVTLFPNRQEITHPFSTSKSFLGPYWLYSKRFWRLLREALRQK